MHGEDNTKAQYTPTPWIRTRRHHAFGVSRGETVIGSSSHGAIADSGGCSTSIEMDEANAEFIVRAVNSHAALVEALEAARRTLRAVIAAHEAEPFRAHLDPAQRFQNDLRNTAGLVVAALAAAKGTK